MHSLRNLSDCAQPIRELQVLSNCLAMPKADGILLYVQRL
jgi:hypothetical protein